MRNDDLKGTEGGGERGAKEEKAQQSHCAGLGDDEWNMQQSEKGSSVKAENKKEERD